MIQWEYNVRLFGAIPGSALEVEFLNGEGLKGWQMFAINQTELSGTFYYFKRQITENNPQ